MLELCCCCFYCSCCGSGDGGLCAERQRWGVGIYVVTAHKPTNVTHSYVGSFTDLLDLHHWVCFGPIRRRNLGYPYIFFLM